MSSKNTLQELCITEKLSPPSYSTKKVGGTAHDPQWISIVTIVKSDGGSFTIPGSVCASKTEAEKSAAVQALESLVIDASDAAEEAPRGTEPDDANAPQGKKKLFILVDVENLPGMLFPAVTLVQRRGKEMDIVIYAFVGQHHHSASKKLGAKITKVVVPTTRKDGVDTFMQMFAGKLLCDPENEQLDVSYAIVTRDHFGHALAELIWTPSGSAKAGDARPSAAWKPKRAAVITTEEQLLAFARG